MSLKQDKKMARHLGLALIFLLASTSCFADKERLYSIKASYVYNLMKFITWPDERLSSNDNIHVGLVGNDPVIKILTKQLVMRHVKSHAITVHNISAEQLYGNTVALQNLHVIYFSQKLFTDEFKIHFKNHSGLLLASYDNFIAEGGMISIVYDPEHDKVNVQINLQALTEQEFIVSAKLLKIASIIK
ncbi:MAG: YfiR family protein [Pseudomonadales bacterium]|nr:YfiR family protein [Pseudomonadales bacterium]